MYRFNSQKKFCYFQAWLLQEANYTNYQKNSLLCKRIIGWEQSLDNPQLLRQEMIETSSISPLELPNAELEEMACKVLSLTENDGYPDDFETCNYHKKIENVFVELKSI